MARQVKEKKVHSQFLSAETIAGPKWRWVKDGFLKSETELVIVATQEQIIRFNSTNASIDKKKANIRYMSKLMK